MKTKIIKVKTKSKNYEVHIGTNIISKLRNIIKKNKPTLLLECHIMDKFLLSNIWKVMKDELNYKYIKINNLNDYIFYITD